MRNGIIGFTGFVGSHLICQSQYDDFYNSKNIDDIEGKNFDLLVCSGAYAAKWIANREPIQDREQIQSLINSLSKVNSKKVILISTVDVYKLPQAVDEDTSITLEDLHPYGKHRRELEIFVRDNFDSLVVRLPGLFGIGLKKNIIYDFLHHNRLDFIHKDSVFQFYNLEHLWQDIQIAIAHNLTLVNFATEPTSVEEVASAAFGFEFTNQPEQIPSVYDMRTKYSSLFSGNKPGYIYDRDRVLQELKQFVDCAKVNLA